MLIALEDSHFMRPLFLRRVQIGTALPHNSRVIKFARNGQYLTHWGKKSPGDGEFNLVHDVVLDKAGRVYVADRTNECVQIFDADREFAIYMCDGSSTEPPCVRMRTGSIRINL